MAIWSVVSRRRRVSRAFDGCIFLKVERRRNMRLLKQAVGVLGTVVVMVVIATVVMPKTTHAIVSTLVTVVNTSANPVPTFPTEALNHFNVTSGCSFAGSFACDVNPIYNVPVGKTAVVEYVSGFCNTEAGTGIALLRLDTVPDNTSGFFVAGPSISLNGTNNINITSWAQSQRFYISSNSTVKFSATATLGSKIGYCLVDISGYLAQ
jgi:hypothetical protein